MLSQDVRIINKLGMHARAASKFIAVAKHHISKVEIGFPGQDMVNGKSIMQVMTLGAEQGDTLNLTIEGEDEQQAMEELLALINDYFGEGE
ncbi:MAG: HPr family phosphocarrier protein [Gammaproteobacteria bacterium]|nr:HPr family phosphocarrier protein [Gammaproteobacteria bacterium]